MSENPNRLDEILDAALRDYSNVEPRAGFDGRILRHVQSAPPVWRAWWGLGWALIPAALGFFFWIGIPARVAPPMALTLSPPHLPAVAQVAVLKTPAPEAKPRRIRPVEPLPLTAEERTLLRFVQNYPEQARAALVLSAQIEEITIEPLKIEELQ